MAGLALSYWLFLDSKTLTKKTTTRIPFLNLPLLREVQTTKVFLFTEACGEVFLGEASVADLSLKSVQKVVLCFLFFFGGLALGLHKDIFFT